MKTRKAIVKLSIIVAVIILGIVFSVASFRIPGTFTDYKSFASAIRMGTDFEGGVCVVYEQNDSDKDDMDNRMNTAVVRMQKVLNNIGLIEASVVRIGTEQIRVDVAAQGDASSIFDALGSAVDLKVKVGDEVILSATDVVKADLVGVTSGVGIRLQLTGAANKALKNATKNDSTASLLIDDAADYTIESTARGAVVFTKSGWTNTQTAYNEASEMVLKISAGSIGVKLAKVSSKTVSPLLGNNAVTTLAIAAGVAVLLVMAFFVLRYKGMGLMAVAAIAAYSALVLFLLAVLPWVLFTGACVAAIAISFAMLVGGLISTYERVREEYRTGKSINASYQAAFRRNAIPQLDSHVVVVLAIVLFWAVTGIALRSFMLCLVVGAFVSLFALVVLSRYLFKQTLIITKENNNFYGLTRDESVKAIEDESEKGEEANETK